MGRLWAFGKVLENSWTVLGKFWRSSRACWSYSCTFFQQAHRTLPGTRQQLSNNFPTLSYNFPKCPTNGPQGFHNILQGSLRIPQSPTRIPQGFARCCLIPANPCMGPCRILRIFKESFWEALQGFTVFVGGISCESNLENNFPKLSVERSPI